MSYTNFNMRLDDDLRANAYPVLEQYGLTPSQAVRMFFNQIAQTKEIPLSLDWAKRITNATTVQAIEAVERGDVTSYEKAEEASKAMLAIAQRKA